MTIRAGYIGLGIMGKALAKHLAPAGLPTIVRDLDEALVAELVASGAKAASSAREVAENADVIGICVPADAHVRAVMRGDDGILAGAAEGTVVVISSTVHPDTVEELALEARAKGVEVLEGPVAGGNVRAEAGDAFYMVAGDEATFERVRPFFEASAGKILYCGELGNAAKLKLALNVLTNLSFAAALEGANLAKGLGLPIELYEEGGQATTMLNPVSMQYMATQKMPDEVLRGEDFQAYMRGRMEICQKDLSLALDMANQADVSMPFTGLGLQLAAKIYGVWDDKLR